MSNQPVESGATSSAESNNHGEQVYFLITFIVMCLFFFTCSAVIEKYKPSYGHETGYTILIGVTISLLIYACVGNKVASSFQFQSTIFFNFFLPPIIFSSGYCMRKKSFFTNLGNVSVFGLAVTLVCFVIYSAAGVGLLKGQLEVTNYHALRTGTIIPAQENPQMLDVTIMQMLLFTALLCSSDVVSAVSIVDYNKQPKLFSCIFGEGVVNDIVSIILFNTVLQLQSVTFQWFTPFIILGQFLMLGVISLTIGVLFGFFTSFVFKYASFIRINAITETFLLFSFSLSSYFISDSIKIAGIQMSGIISLLVCGIVQSQYTYYNLSPQGKQCSLLTSSFLGTAAEAGVYSYIGIALYSLIETWWSFEFIAAVFVIIVGGRIIAVFSTFYFFRLCFKKKTINFRELCFITYAGMIRGAIAFALVLKIPVEGTPECHGTGCLSKVNYDLLVTTTLILVMLTTLIFGTFIQKVQTLLVPPTEADRAEALAIQKSEDAVLGKALSKRVAIHAEQEESHEEIVHPNEERDSDSDSIIILVGQQNEPASWTTSRFYKWFSLYDEHVLKPILIRKYKRQVQLLEDEYQDLVAQQFDDEDEEILVHKVENLYQAQIEIPVPEIQANRPRFFSSHSLQNLHLNVVPQKDEIEGQIEFQRIPSKQQLQVNQKNQQVIEEFEKDKIKISEQSSNSLTFEVNDQDDFESSRKLVEKNLVEFQDYKISN